jgi:hypothetical protein
MKPTDIPDVRCFVKVLKQGTAAAPARVRPIFVIPDEVYEKYNSDTDFQFEISSAFLDLLEKTVGEELAERHVLDIKFMPADPSQFWRDPRPTSKNAPAQPATPADTHPLEKLRELFEAAIAEK